MSFDPSFPPDNSELRPGEFRNQFNGLDEKLTAQIAAIPAGVGGSGAAGALAQWTDDHTLAPAAAQTLKDRSPIPGWTCNTFIIPAPTAGGNPLYIDVDSNGNFAFRITADGTGESVWVSADGVWHFMAGIETPGGMVTGQQLTDATAGTSANTNAVELLSPDADLPTTVAKLNELIQAQRR